MTDRPANLLEDNSMTDQTEPRALTEEELRDMLLDHVRALSKYWAELPVLDKATGRELTAFDRCEGVAFSILSCLDGCSYLPAFDLVAQPHEDDKEFHRAEGENWIEPGTTISTMLHEFFYKRTS